MADLRFITDLNAEVYISVKGESPRGLQRAVLDAMYAFSELGWQSDAVPADGCRFPPPAELEVDRQPFRARREE